MPFPGEKDENSRANRLDCFSWVSRLTRSGLSDKAPVFSTHFKLEEERMNKKWTLLSGLLASVVINIIICIQLTLK